MVLFGEKVIVHWLIDIGKDAIKHSISVSWIGVAPMHEKLGWTTIVQIKILDPVRTGQNHWNWWFDWYESAVFTSFKILEAFR